MGREARIEYAAGRQRAQVKAHLDSFALELSGEKKLKLPLGDVKTAVADGELLKIDAGGTRFTLKLGAKDAASWAKKILNPPTLADKLGVKAGISVALVGERVAEIDAAVKAAAKVTHAASLTAAGRLAADIAVVTLAPATAEKQITAAAKAIGPKTALWFVYRKGTKPNGDDIIGLARAAGLKDTKVARVSETHAALRFIRAKS
jgi:hypothetical protein